LLISKAGRDGKKFSYFLHSANISGAWLNPEILEFSFNTRIFLSSSTNSNIWAHVFFLLFFSGLKLWTPKSCRAPTCEKFCRLNRQISRVAWRAPREKLPTSWIYFIVCLAPTVQSEKLFGRLKSQRREKRFRLPSLMIFQ